MHVGAVVFGDIGNEGGVTADWGDIVENDKAYQAIKPVIQAHIKTALGEVFTKEMNLQRARLQQQLNARLSKLPEYRQRYARLALEKVMKRFYGESEERIETVASVVLDALEKDEYWSILQHIDESPSGDIEALASAPSWPNLNLPIGLLALLRM
jgi:hypothetical protein